MKTIDAQGKSCPVPLIMTKKALDEMEEHETLEILIDNATSVGNVQRFLEEHHLKVNVTQTGNTYKLTVNKTGEIPEQTRAEAYCSNPAPISTGYIIALQKSTLGQGDDELGALLMKGFINTLPDISTKPATMVFLNSGIFLAVKGSPVLEALSTLEKAGVRILVCGTCLDFFQKKEELGVGQVSNMYDILDAMTKAVKVIYP